jgi:hypothetical protein
MTAGGRLNDDMAEIKGQLTRSLVRKSGTVDECQGLKRSIEREQKFPGGPSRIVCLREAVPILTVQRQAAKGKSRGSLRDEIIRTLLGGRRATARIIALESEFEVFVNNILRSFGSRKTLSGTLLRLIFM